MTKAQKIQKLLDRLDELEARDPVGSVKRLLEEEAESVRTNLKETPTGTALKVLARGVAKVQGDPRPQKILKDLEKVKEESRMGMEGLAAGFSEKIESLLEEIRATEQRGTELTKAERDSILARFSEHEGTYSSDMASRSTKDALIEAEVSRIAQEIPKIYASFPEIPNLTPAIEENAQNIQTVAKSTEDITKALEALEKRLTSRIGSLNNHGGNMNRNIAIGGNTSVLSTYTDINLKAGTNVTITYTKNDATKYTDVTISASGGGGGSGITREINTVAISTLAGSLPSIDYVYLCAGTLTITLPTAVGNENLYTVKNTGAGIVTIDTTGGETIDGDTTVIMPVQFTSVDLISNGSNWAIT